MSPTVFCSKPTNYNWLCQMFTFHRFFRFRVRFSHLIGLYEKSKQVLSCFFFHLLQKIKVSTCIYFIQKLKIFIRIFVNRFTISTRPFYFPVATATFQPALINIIGCIIFEMMLLLMIATPLAHYGRRAARELQL